MEEGLFDKLRNMSGKFPERFNILEEQIDVKLQLEYFKVSKKIKQDAKKLKVKLDIDTLPNINQTELSDIELKEALVKLASIDDAKAYRIIELFSKNKEHDLYNWALLALQESKMLLESSLLDEDQVFISTGLGGRGNMLRYFIVLVGKDVSEFQQFQQNMIETEFNFALKNNSSILEHLDYNENYVLLTVLIPFDVEFQKILKQAVEECNQYGGFLKDNFLITNVKKLELTEIKDIVENHNMPTAESLGNLDIEDLDDNNEEIEDKSDDEK